MNPREKLLAVLVGATLVLALGFAGGLRILNMFEMREGQLAALSAKVRENDNTVRRAKRANQKLVAYRKRSLPSDPDRAHTLYRQWLLKTSQEVGLTNPIVKPSLGRTRKGDAYAEVRFQVEAEGSLEQLTRLLHRFYSSDDLHRIQWMSVKPIKDSPHCDITLHVTGLSLPQADDRLVLGNLPAPGMQDKKLDDYVAAIVSRNLFAPANQAPSFAAIKTPAGIVGQSLEIALAATDPDAGTIFSYAIDGEIPQGMSIDSRKGTIRWRPKEVGEIQLAVRVSDNGVPSLSDTKSFKVVVRDPPPKEDPPASPPSFDDSRHAHVAAIVEVNRERQVWIDVRSKGEMLKLVVGDTVQVGSFDGVISAIGPELESAEMDTKQGTVSVRLGECLADARSVQKPIQSARN
jgi:hypothetical protein